APDAAPDAAPALEIENLTVRYPIRAGLLRRTVAEICAVENVSLSVRRGETLGLVGESGCGKSTLARAALRLTPVRSGAIRICGRDVTRLRGAALKPMRRAAQIVFQDPFAALNPRLPAWDLTTEPAAIHGFAATRADRRDLAAALMRRVGLSADMLDRYAHQFSGGQRQRLCIARALSVGPALVIADEAVSALDVSVARQVTELMRDLQERDGLAFLFISHDIGVVERMSHRIAVMYAGEIVETGPAAAVLGDPRHAYTRRLLAAVPSGDPRRRSRAPLPGGDVEPPSLIRPVGTPSRSGALSQVERDRFVRRDAA
ncbi:ATP-binding cassette domain-containing protein, partial [Rubrimonas sp.]|uniref:ATP-binding cassette domain-containing protein n=1 Tax=Rubrimonas sp. TaxID=2036015 RepID=UPI002FDDC1DA